MKSRFLLATAAALTTLGVSSSAFAGALNNWGCKPAPGDFPVIFVHGRGGGAAQGTKTAEALPTKCVFALDYGKMNGQGSNGMAHLDQSGGELAAFANKVMQATGATQIDAVGYSEGGMVIDNYILTKGGGNKVHRYVGIAGAHYPYASEGVAIGGTGTLYCPTLISTVQKSFPPFTSNLSSKDIMKMVVAAAPNAFGGDSEVVQSDFVVDLFDEKYWIRTHGKLSEPITQAASVKTGDAVRTFHTPGATSPNTCYINIIAPFDGFVGAATGYNDKNYNVVNQIGASTVQHGGVADDDGMLKQMAAAFLIPITPGATVNCGGSAPEADDLGNGSGGDNGQGEGSNGGSNSGDPNDPNGNGSSDPSNPSDPSNGNGNGGTNGGTGSDGTGSNSGNGSSNGSGASPDGSGDASSENSGCSVGSTSSSTTTSFGGLAGLGLLGLAIASRRRSRA